MKKKLLALALTTTLLLGGCGSEYNEENVTKEDFANGYFTEINSCKDIHGNYKIVYANDTKIKYFIVSGSKYTNGITPLYNADGTLQVYEEK